MKTEAINKMKTLMAFSSAAGNFWDNYDKETDHARCDKFAAGFTETTGYMVFTLESPLTFAAYTGYYGDSSCTTFGDDFDDALIKKYLPQALNTLNRALFERMSELAALDAQKIANAVEKEINNMQQVLADARAVA